MLSQQIAGDKLKEELFEDMLINSFIAEEVGIVMKPSSAVDSKYGQSRTEQKYVYDTVAFDYFSKEYEKMQVEHPKLRNISFENFIKLHNPTKEFMSDLRKAVPDKNSPAYLYESVYNQDFGLMRHSAINGYKLKLEAEQDNAKKSGAVASVGGAMQEGMEEATQSAMYPAAAATSTGIQQGMIEGGTEGIQEVLEQAIGTGGGSLDINKLPEM